MRSALAARISAACGEGIDGEWISTAFCEGNLAKYKIPRQIAFLADLPKGDSGKILKRKLAELDVQA